jgi:hypothetical protein
MQMGDTVCVCDAGGGTTVRFAHAVEFYLFLTPALGLVNTENHG